MRIGWTASMGAGALVAAIVLAPAVPPVHASEPCDADGWSGHAWTYDLAAEQPEDGSPEGAIELSQDGSWRNHHPEEEAVFRVLLDDAVLEEGFWPVGGGNRIDLPPEGELTFCFVAPGEIVVEKDVAEHDDQDQEFEFVASYESETFWLSDSSGPHSSGPLLPATYTVEERTDDLPFAWFFEEIECGPTSGSRLVVDGPRLEVELAPGDTVRCEFDNEFESEPVGRVRVKKAVDSGEAPQQSFRFSFTDEGEFTLEDGESRTFDLPLDDGPRSVVIAEHLPEGWSLTGVDCSTADGSPVGTGTDDGVELTVDDRDDITCVFRNAPEGVTTTTTTDADDDDDDGDDDDGDDDDGDDDNGGNRSAASVSVRGECYVDVSQGRDFARIVVDVTPEGGARVTVAEALVEEDAVLEGLPAGTSYPWTAEGIGRQLEGPSEGSVVVEECLEVGGIQVTTTSPAAPATTTPPTVTASTLPFTGSTEAGPLAAALLASGALLLAGSAGERRRGRPHHEGWHNRR